MIRMMCCTTSLFSLLNIIDSYYKTINRKEIIFGILTHLSFNLFKIFNFPIPLGQNCKRYYLKSKLMKCKKIIIEIVSLIISFYILPSNKTKLSLLSDICIKLTNRTRSIIARMTKFTNYIELLKRIQLDNHFAVYNKLFAISINSKRYIRDTLDVFSDIFPNFAIPSGLCSFKKAIRIVQNAHSQPIEFQRTNTIFSISPLDNIIPICAFTKTEHRMIMSDFLELTLNSITYRLCWRIGHDKTSIFFQGL